MAPPASFSRAPFDSTGETRQEHPGLRADVLPGRAQGGLLGGDIRIVGHRLADELIQRGGAEQRPPFAGQILAGLKPLRFPADHVSGLGALGAGRRGYSPAWRAAVAHGNSDRRRRPTVATPKSIQVFGSPDAPLTFANHRSAWRPRKSPGDAQAMPANGSTASDCMQAVPEFPVFVRGRRIVRGSGHRTLPRTLTYWGDWPVTANNVTLVSALSGISPGLPPFICRK